MKRWFPLAFLGASLLANIIVKVLYAQYLSTWTKYADFPIPQSLGLFALLSLPVALVLLWKLWEPDEQRRYELGKHRRWAGKILLWLSVFAWFFFGVKAIVEAWMAATPAPDPLGWLERSALMSILSTACLAIGGLVALWLMGTRFPKKAGK